MKKEARELILASFFRQKLIMLIKGMKENF